CGQEETLALARRRRLPPRERRRGRRDRVGRLVGPAGRDLGDDAVVVRVAVLEGARPRRRPLAVDVVDGLHSFSRRSALPWAIFARSSGLTGALRRNDVARALTPNG